MKVCTRCQQGKPDTEYHRKSKSGVLHAACKECHRQYVKTHYDANKTYYLNKANKHRKKSKAEMYRVIREYKSQPCADCSVSYPTYVMDFDHVKGTKVSDITTMIRKQRTMEVLLAEIVKCEVVCANCHRERTYKRIFVPVV